MKTKPRVGKNRVLVTGGAGFVGSHLCEFLVNRGDHVGLNLWELLDCGGGDFLALFS